MTKNFARGYVSSLGKETTSKTMQDIVPVPPEN